MAGPPSFDCEQSYSYALVMYRPGPYIPPVTSLVIGPRPRVSKRLQATEGVIVAGLSSPTTISASWVKHFYERRL